MASSIVSRDRIRYTDYLGSGQQGKNCYLNQPMLYKPWVGGNISVSILWIRCEMRWTSRAFFKFSGKYLLINCSMLESKTRFGVLEIITFRHIGHVVGFLFLLRIQTWIPTLWTVNEVLGSIDILGIDMDIHPCFG